jgi:hypothetical protein
MWWRLGMIVVLEDLGEHQIDLILAVPGFQGGLF